MSVSVCAFVCLCLSLREYISGIARPILTNFLCLLLVAVAQSSSSCRIVIIVLVKCWRFRVRVSEAGFCLSNNTSARLSTIQQLAADLFSDLQFTQPIT